MNRRALPGAILFPAALGALALLPGGAAAAEIELPDCNGVVLDTGPTLFSSEDARGAGAAGLLPEIELPPILDPPDIELPEVLPPGLKLIDGGDLAAEVLCVRVRRPGGTAAAGEEAGRRSGCRRTRIPAHKMRANRARKAVLCLVDKARRRRGKGVYRPSRALKRSSKGHSRRMVGSGCFSHQCSGEPPLPSRVTRTGYLPCRCSWRVGENIAYGSGWRGSARSVVRAWMKSPSHKQAILDSFRHGDVGVRAGNPGRAKAKGGTYTMNFGLKR